MLLPDYGFDVSESALPWKVFRQHNVAVEFATERGALPKCDQRLLDGHWLFPFMQASPEARQAYAEMSKDPNFLAPRTWDDGSLSFDSYDLVFVPGGHDKGVRQLLESLTVRVKLAAFWRLVVEGKRIAGTICHGVLLFARTKDTHSGRALLHGRATTGLPGYLETLVVTITRPLLGDYYRTYPNATVEEEACAADADWRRGPLNLLGNTAREAAFVVQDGHYYSARWPGDAELLALKLVAALRTL